MVTVSTNIENRQQAQAVMVDVIKNPLKSPAQAVQWLTKNVNLSAAFGKTIGGLIPGAGSIIGSLTDIFSAFSSAPSLGEIVTDGLNSLSMQISDLKNELTLTIEKTAEMQIAKTVDYVLQGVDEIQQEVSAAQIMQDIADTQSLQAVAEQKLQIYSEYLSEYQAMQESAYRELSNIIKQCEIDLQALYNSINARFSEMGFDLFSFFKSMTAQPSAPGSRSAPPAMIADGQPDNKPKAETGFNWLYLSPLLLLLFNKKK